MSLAIAVRDLGKRYGDRDALRQLTLEIPTGGCFGVLGPNGSGKTTLMKILAGLVRPTTGSAVVAGCSLPKESFEARRRLGVLFDRPLLPRDFTLREGLLYHAELYQVPDARARIDELVGRAGLTWRVRDPVRTFSRGMAQRVSLICALLSDPEVLILDEPFTGLDPEGCGLVEASIEEMREAGKTVLLVTHEMPRVERLCEGVAVLKRGQLAFLGESNDWTLANVLAVYE